MSQHTCISCQSPIKGMPFRLYRAVDSEDNLRHQTAWCELCAKAVASHNADVLADHGQWQLTEFEKP
jgi:hypothetical protein